MALVALLTLPRLASVWEKEHGAVLVATERDAFVVLSMSSYGWTGSPMRLAVGLAKGAVGGAVEYDHKRSRLLLVRIRPDAVRRYVVDGPGGRAGLLDGTVVVAGAGVGLRWTGDGFVRLTDAEKSDAISRMVDRSNSSQGVLRQRLLSDPHTDVTFVLNGETYRLRADRRGRLTSLLLSRAGGPTETIVSVDGGVKMVSWTTYAELFGQDQRD